MPSGLVGQTVPNSKHRRLATRIRARCVALRNAVLFGQRSRPSAFAGCSVLTQSPPEERQAQLVATHRKAHRTGFGCIGRCESACNRKKARVSFSSVGSCGSISRLKVTPAHQVRPNPSLKLSPNGGPPRPGQAVPCTSSPARARASHRRCQLSSNVRPHKFTFLGPHRK